MGKQAIVIYLGYKNARFGRIEAHEAVTAYSRDALLTAKETAEEAGYRVLHMYVDALWVQRAALTETDARQLLDAVAAQTNLPIALEGIYRWIAFLPSRLDERIPVPNRYFGVFNDGSLKTRGIELNRGDTPPFIAAAQHKALQILAALPPEQPLAAAAPAVITHLRAVIADLRAARIPLTDLLVTHRVSRMPDEFRAASPAAQASASNSSTPSAAPASTPGIWPAPSIPPPSISPITATCSSAPPAPSCSPWASSKKTRARSSSAKQSS